MHFRQCDLQWRALLSNYQVQDTVHFWVPRCFQWLEWIMIQAENDTRGCVHMARGETDLVIADFNRAGPVMNAILSWRRAARCCTAWRIPLR